MLKFSIITKEDFLLMTLNRSMAHFFMREMHKFSYLLAKLSSKLIRNVSVLN